MERAIIFDKYRNFLRLHQQDTILVLSILGFLGILTLGDKYKIMSAYRFLSICGRIIYDYRGICPDKYIVYEK